MLLASWACNAQTFQTMVNPTRKYSETKLLCSFLFLSIVHVCTASKLIRIYYRSVWFFVCRSLWFCIVASLRFKVIIFCNCTFQTCLWRPCLYFSFTECPSEVEKLPMSWRPGKAGSYCVDCRCRRPGNVSSTLSHCLFFNDCLHHVRSLSLPLSIHRSGFTFQML